MNQKTIYLAGGCFWGCQKYFDLLQGVLETEVGYANGPTKNPSYDEVKHHAGHAETVRIVYDADTLPLQKLLDAYFKVIDPTAATGRAKTRGSNIGQAYIASVMRTRQSLMRRLPIWLDHTENILPLKISCFSASTRLKIITKSTLKKSRWLLPHKVLT